MQLLLSITITALASFALTHALQRLEDQKKRTANMTEVSFAKSFLTTLDNKPTKYQQNHIFDPNTFGVRIPVSAVHIPQHPSCPQLT